MKLKRIDIKGTTGDDELIGTAAAERIRADAGDDIIVGGSGDDILAGGKGTDLFVFGAGDGHDVVRDLRIGEDRLLLLGIDPSAITVEHTSANSTTIHYGEGDSIRLVGVNSDNLSEFLDFA